MSRGAASSSTTASLWWVPAGALLAALLLLATPLRERWSLPFTDMQSRWAAREHSAGGVLVIDVDDASLRELQPRLGAWPYPRDVYALVIETLREAGARAIVIDLLLSEPAAGDRALARTLARDGAPVVLAAAGLRGPVVSDRRAPGTALKSDGRALPAQPWPDLALPAPSVWSGLQTLPPVGVITNPLDTDGRLRRMALWHESNGLRWPSLPLAVWQATTPAGSAQAWPVDARGRIVVPAPAADRGLPVLAFSALARAALGDAEAATLADAVRGRVVFIGSSALLGDAVLVPSGQISGTVMLAHTYAALRDHHVLTPPSQPTEALLLALALLPSLWTWRRRTARPVLDIGAAVAGVGAVVLAGWALLHGGQALSNWALAFTALAAGAALSLVAHQRAMAATQQRLANERAVAAEASRAKSEFLANVSHEIRTPMNALLGIAELLAETPLSPEQRRHVEVFRSSGRALFELINDLLDLSKIEAGKLELNREPMRLHALLEQQIALLAPRAREKGLTLELAIAADVPAVVSGDGPRLAQALTNLLGNAIKFTLNGSVRLDVSRGTGHDELCFSIVDTGIGIAPSKLESIFEPFTQADGSVTRSFGGTGLGLSITRSLVALMRGTISVKSEPGRGTTFELCLPLPPAEMPAEAVGAAARPLPSHSVAAAPLVVLLAEDNDVNVYLFMAMLADTGCRIEVAANGQSAVEHWRRAHYDVVFMDVQMPVLDGHAATREIRRLEAELGRPHTPIFALSAHAFASDARASLDAGCDAHLTKPIAKAELRAALAPLQPGVEMPQQMASPAAPAQHADVIDDAAALQRMGGNADLLASVRQHASVFISSWRQSHDRALAHGDAAQAKRLAHDLKSVAATIGAQTLSEAAAELQSAFDAPSCPTAVDVAQAQVDTAIVPVIAALTNAAT